MYNCIENMCTISTISTVYDKFSEQPVLIFLVCKDKVDSLFIFSMAL